LQLLVLVITPTELFRSQSADEKTAMIARLAAPVQEWTGADGGVMFSERVLDASGVSSVVLIVRIQVAQLAQAVLTACETARAAGYVTFTPIFGPEIAMEKPGDRDEADRTLRLISKPFLDC
jgi:hypothetical protein